MNPPAKVLAEGSESRRPVLRIVLFFLAVGGAVVLITALTAFLIYNSFSQPRHDAKALAPNVHVNAFAALDTADSFPVGLAAGQDGAMVLTLFGKGEIAKIDMNGKTTPWIGNSAAITAPGSAAYGPDHALYLIDYTSSNPGKAVGRIKRIMPDGKVESFGVTPNSADLPLFSQLAFDNAGNLYVTNPSPTGSAVWKFDLRGQGQVWWSAPDVGNVKGQPTGISYDAAHQAMIIGDAGTGTLYRVVIGSDGRAGEALVLHRETGMEIQAVALDEQNRVLFAVWAHDNGQLNRLESDGAVTALADNFRAPTAIVYRDGKAYVVNSDLLGIIPPIFGIIPSPLHARPPFTVDVVTSSK